MADYQLPLNTDVVIENVARVNIDSDPRIVIGNPSETYFLKHNGGGGSSTSTTQNGSSAAQNEAHKLGLSVAPNTNSSTEQKTLGRGNMFQLRSLTQQKIEMLPLSFAPRGKVPCFRAYITNASGSLGVSCTDIESVTGHGAQSLDMEHLSPEFDTPMAQWWLIPAETAFPAHPNLKGTFIVRSFAGNGMFLASDDSNTNDAVSACSNSMCPVIRSPFRDQHAHSDSNNNDLNPWIDVWRISRCAVGDTTEKSPFSQSSLEEGGPTRSKNSSDTTGRLQRSKSLSGLPTDFSVGRKNGTATVLKQQPSIKFHSSFSPGRPITRQRLVDLYTEYEPHKLPTVDLVLSKINETDDPEVAFQHLANKAKKKIKVKQQLRQEQTKQNQLIGGHYQRNSSYGIADKSGGSTTPASKYASLHGSAASSSPSTPPAASPPPIQNYDAPPPITSTGASITPGLPLFVPRSYKM